MIERWVLVDAANNEEDYEYERYDDAVSDAEGREKAVIERQYTFADSELVWTPDGSGIWPPPKQETDDDEEEDS